MIQLRQLLVSSRPVSWVNTAYPFAAGYLLTARPVDWPLLIIGSVYFLIPYNLLMYGINDVFDYESDLRNPRKGGVEGAVLHREFHRQVIWSAILTNLPFVAYLLLRGSLSSAVTLLVVVGLVVAYSAPVLRFKERPVLDSATSSAHFVGPMVFALALAGWPAAAWPYVVAFFAWGMASHAFGAVQDILADRTAGIGSIATVIGARSTVWLTAALYALCAVILALQPSWIARLMGAASLLYVLNVVPFWRITNEQAPVANRGWKRFIWLNPLVGFILTLALLAWWTSR